MNAILLFAFTQTKRFFRDPIALFFTFAFPLIFLFVFGGIFGSNDNIKFEVAIYNNSDTAFAKKFVSDLTSGDTFEQVSDAGTIESAKEKMGRGELDTVLVLPQDFGNPNKQSLPSGQLEVYYDEAKPQTGQTVASVLSSVLAGINNDLTKTAPPFSVKQVATTNSGLSNFDYTFSGLLGFSMLSLAIFGLASRIPADKNNGSLRRIRATPFRPSQLIVGTMLYYGFIGALAVLLMIILGVTIFNFDMRGDWLQFALFSIPSFVMLLGFGLLVGGASKNENQSAVLTQIVALPMMFLSGVFFPRFLMPDWLQAITAYIPLSPVIDGIRMITTEAKTVLDLGPELGLIAIWIVIVYLLTIKLFRWE